MAERSRTNILVGLFMLSGLGAIAYLAVVMTRFDVGFGAGYTIQAQFSDLGGLKQGAAVEIAGVPVGTVKGISLDRYQAKVDLKIDKGVEIPDDSSLSVKTKGLLGEKFLEISPGASASILSDGSMVMDTQSAFDIHDAIGRYMFGDVGGSGNGKL